MVVGLAPSRVAPVAVAISNINASISVSSSSFALGSNLALSVVNTEGLAIKGGVRGIINGSSSERCHFQ